MIKFSDMDVDETECPFCGHKEGLVVNDYTMRHNREVLIECGNCDKLYKVYYKFDKVVGLEEKPFDNKLQGDEKNGL